MLEPPDDSRAANDAAPAAASRDHHRYLVAAAGLRWALRYRGALVDTFTSRQAAVDFAKALASFRMAGRGTADVMVQVKRGSWRTAWRSDEATR